MAIEAATIDTHSITTAPTRRVTASPPHQHTTRNSGIGHPSVTTAGSTCRKDPGYTTASRRCSHRDMLIANTTWRNTIRQINPLTPDRRLLNIYLPASLRPSLNIYFRKLISGGTPSIIITTPLHHYEQEHLESRLAKS